MPYPLPDGDPPYTTDLRWFLVAIPDDAAFVRAALGIYTELASYWKWGKEGNEAGRQDAAETWQTAVEATLESLEMGFPDILLGYIDQVEGLLTQLIEAQCACDAVQDPIADLKSDDWTTGDSVPENIVSAGYASSTSDQAGYTDYKCLIANVAVQDLIEKVERMATLIESSGWVTGGVGAIAALLAFVFALPAGATIITAMAIGIIGGAGAAAGVWAWLNSVGKASAESVALALDAAYDQLVCAIYQADGNVSAASAVHDVIEAEAGAAAATALTPVISMVIDALYAGRYDQTNTAQSLANAGFTLAQHDCDCEYIPENFTLTPATYTTPITYQLGGTLTIDNPDLNYVRSFGGGDGDFHFGQATYAETVPTGCVGMLTLVVALTGTNYGDARISSRHTIGGFSTEGYMVQYTGTASQAIKDEIAAAYAATTIGSYNAAATTCALGHDDPTGAGNVDVTIRQWYIIPV